MHAEGTPRPSRHAGRLVAVAFDQEAATYGKDFRRHYDSAMSSLEQACILRFARNMQGEVLDLGTGRGRYAACLLQARPEISRVIGIDVSRNMLLAARALTKDSRFEALLSDGHQLPLAKDSL